MAEELSPWLRRAVIRGDVASVGLALVGGGLLWLAAAGLGTLTAVSVVGSLVLVGAGIAIVRVSRVHWRRLLRETVAAHAEHDPGDSPVPWVDDALWRRRNRFDPVLDAPVVLMAEVDPLLQPFGEDANGAFEDPVLRPVGDQERELLPPGEPGPEPWPPTGHAEEHLRRLRDTPGRQIVVSPRWPVCCARLTTLVSDKQADTHPDAHHLPAGPTPEDFDADEVVGQLGFVCRACGRRYATDPAW